MAQIQTNAGALGAHTVIAPVRGGENRRRGPWTALGLAAIGVAVVAVGAWVVTGSRDVPASTTPAIAGGAAAARPALDAYAPGGSVYQQQVPAAAPFAGSVYAPGGSVYQQQVPSAATFADSVYAPGGSVYEQQVP